MAKPVDLELKRAFMELQAKMAESTKKMQIIDSQISGLTSSQRILDVTQRQVAALPADTKTYETVGRMFVLTDLEEVKGNLSNRKSQLSARALELEKNKKYLEKSLKESEDNIREMLQQRKENGEAKA